MKRSLILIVLLFTAAVSASCAKKEVTTEQEPAKTNETAVIEQAPDSDRAYIEKSGTLRIGIIEYTTSNGDNAASPLTGFYVEMAELVCEKLGIEAEFVTTGPETAGDELNNKTIDCIWNVLTGNEGYIKNADFTKPYLCNKQVTVISVGTAEQYTKPEDLEGLPVAAAEGSDGATALLKTFPGAIFLAVGSQDDALLEVKSGTAEAAVIDLTTAEALTGEGGKYEDLLIVHSINMQDKEFAVGFRRGSDMAEKVNGILVSLKNDGLLEKIAEKHKIVGHLCAD